MPPLSYQAPERVSLFAQETYSSTTPEMIEYEARKAGAVPEVAVAIAEAESNFNPLAKNPLGSASGIFQLTRGFRDDFCPGIDPFDPVANTRCAVGVMADDGYDHWGASARGWSGF